jgi:hypothetical protein
MDQIQQAILTLLNQSGVGKQSAMTADAIFAALTAQNLPVIQGRTQEHVRQSISSMVNDHGQLIGSGRTGYYIITSRDEVIDTIMDLVSRSRSNLDRGTRLRNEWNALNPNNII